MTATEHAIEITKVAALAAVDKLATDVVAFDVSQQLAITDVFLIATARNERQVGAVVDAIEAKLVEQKIKPLRREGDREQRWVLLDFGDIVVHVQHTEERARYSLEKLWRDCPSIPLDLPTAPSAAAEDTDAGQLYAERA